jgi:hypothetical protein
MRTKLLIGTLALAAAIAAPAIAAAKGGLASDFGILLGREGDHALADVDGGASASHKGVDAKLDADLLGEEGTRNPILADATAHAGRDSQSATVGSTVLGSEGDHALADVDATVSHSRDNGTTAKVDGDFFGEEGTNCPVLVDATVHAK